MRYVLDTGALIAAERGKARIARFFRLAAIGSAELVVPLPVLAEWWRGRTAIREKILAATHVHASVATMQAAGVALNRIRDIDAKRTIDAMVMATASLLDAIVITQDITDFEALAPTFPGVTILTI